MNLMELTATVAGFTESDRPIRLRLSQGHEIYDDVLMVQHVSGTEALCGGLQYRLLCVSTRADLPLKQFIASPVELQFVTDRGDLRAVCGIVAQAAAGQSDGGLATYQLVVRDALALMEHRTNTRVFRNKDELDISRVILDEWRHTNSVLAAAFEVDWSHVTGSYPAREFTMQHNESDADFLRRLWKRRGIAWFIDSGQANGSEAANPAVHRLVLFDEDKWYSLLRKEWINPSGLPARKGGGTFKRTCDYLDKVQAFHKQIRDTFHPNSYAHYGADAGRPSFGEVVWEISDYCTDPTGWRDWLISYDTRQGRLEVVRHETDPPAAPYAETFDFGPASIYATLLPLDSPGDQTVPAKSADHQLRSGKFKGVFRQIGYEHQSSCKDRHVVASTLYCIVRIAQHAKWVCVKEDDHEFHSIS